MADDAGVTRTDVELPVDGSLVRAWWYRPGRSGPHPTVVMAHGFAGVKAAGLDAYASRFAAAGFAVVAFDYRSFGDSEGRPRQIIDIGRQLEDWEAAIEWARTHPEVDPARLALWGTSFSGGHVLVLAARHPEIAATIAQVPFVDGIASATAADGGSADLLMRAFTDLRSRRYGGPPVRVPVYGHPGAVAALTSPSSEEGYRRLVPDGAPWVNEVGAGIVLRVPFYRPGRRAGRITHPVLLCVADHDDLTPAGAAIATGRRIRRGEVRRYACGHFDLYHGELFDRAVADQIEFLERHLGDHRPRPVAVVTGAGGGVGAAIADRLERRRWTVVRTDVAGTDRVLDVTDAEACRALAREVRPQLWVNNAGVLGAGRSPTQPDAEIQRVVAVNLLGVVNGSRAAAEVMAAQGHGRILNIGSLASWTPVPGETVYAATKAGVLSFSVGFASELTETGVHVHVLCPDGIWSPMLEPRVHDPSAALSFTGPRLLSVDEVADEALALVESGRFLRSIPRWRGVQTRLIGIAPTVAMRGAGLFERIGRRNQARLAAQLAEPPPPPPPHDDLTITD